MRLLELLDRGELGRRRRSRSGSGLRRLVSRCSTQYYPAEAAKLAASSAADADDLEDSAWPAIDWTAGDAARGRGVFERRACHRCHQVSGHLGPELKGAVSRLSRDDLFTAIVDPEPGSLARFSDHAGRHDVGQVYHGLVVYESPEGTLLQTGPGHDGAHHGHRQSSLRTAAVADADRLAGYAFGPGLERLVRLFENSRLKYECRDDLVRSSQSFGDSRVSFDRKEPTMPKASARHILVDTQGGLRRPENRRSPQAPILRPWPANTRVVPREAKAARLGEFSPGQMVPEFDRVVFSAPVGDVQGPVKTQFGWHLVEVTSRTP